MQQQKQKKKAQERVVTRPIGAHKVTREQTASVTVHEGTIAKARAQMAEAGQTEVFIGIMAVIMHITEDMGGGVLSAVDGSPLALTCGTFATFDAARGAAVMPFGTGAAVARVTADAVTLTVV